MMSAMYKQPKLCLHGLPDDCPYCKERTIADLTRQLAEAKAKANHYEDEFNRRGASTAKALEQLAESKAENERLSALLSENQHMHSVEVASMAALLERAEKERDAARLRSENSEGMAECMDMLRRDLIAAGVIADSVPPMFMTEAVLGAIQKAQARAKWLEVENANNLDLLRAERDLVASVWEASGAENGRSLVEQIAALRADAERYRWLRDQLPHHNEPDLTEPVKTICIDSWKGSLGKHLKGDDANAAIDAARKEAK